ncbi:hypothetical protein [Chryseobacterium gossypii]|uniref:hypothetical protein n=1 Tax=Chryseobacterium gossypii TaxID=3231602 RepID=UPI003523732D
MKKIAVLLSLFSFTLFFSQESQNYVRISYSSICCGTPSAEPVMSYLDQFQKKNRIRSFEVYRESGLGREGEFNLYIGTDKLSKRQKSNFIKGLKDAVSSQNAKRNRKNAGTVNFDETVVVTKADLSNVKNLTVYKNNLIK